MAIQEDIGYYGALLAVVTRDGAECLRDYLCEQILKNPLKTGSDRNTSRRILNDYIDPSEILLRNDLWNEEERDLLSHGTGLPLDDMSFALTAKIIQNFLPSPDGKIIPDWWTTTQPTGNDHCCDIQQIIQLYKELYDASTTHMTKEHFDVKWNKLISNLEKIQASFDKEHYCELYKLCENLITAEDYFELLHELNQTKMAHNRHKEDGKNHENLSDGDSGTPDEVCQDDVVDSGMEMEMKVINALHFYPEDANNPDLPNFGRLSVLHILGRGGFGNVWLYEDVKSGEKVAVKQGTSTSKYALKIMTNEIQIIRGLKHERIVRYYGARVINGRFSFLMEFVPNGSLRDKIKEEGYLKESSTRHYTKQILEGLVYLHSHLVIHRDVKAANVMLTERNDIKLADFGLAWKLPKERDHASGRAGTIVFLAPEVAKGEPYGMKADIWSLGCTILEMMLGDPPLANVQKDTEVIVRMVANTPPIFVLPGSVSLPFKALINQIFNLKADKRPTAKELIKHCAFNMN